MKQQMDIKTFVRLLQRRMMTILLTMISISVIGSVIVFYFLPPSYEVSKSILVGPLSTDEEHYVDSQTVNRMIASTVDFINSPIVMESVWKNSGLTRAELEEKMAVKNKKDSQIISIVIKDSDPKRAQKIVRQLADTSVKRIRDSMDIKSIAVLNNHGDLNKPKKLGNPIVNVLIAVMAGLFCGLGMALLREHWDDAVQTIDQLEQELGLPVLCMVKGMKG